MGTAEAGNLGISVASSFWQPMRRVGLENEQAMVEAWHFLLGSLKFYLEGVEQSRAAEVF